MRKPAFIQVAPSAGSWPIPPKGNGVWECPEAPVNEVRFEMEHRGPWSLIVSCRALCVSLDGRIYGVRSLDKPREEGYNLGGSVRVMGKRYRAFTSSRLFEREDKSLCDVATIVACVRDERCSKCGEMSPYQENVPYYALKCPKCGTNLR